jgi:hypothetical protein
MNLVNTVNKKVPNPNFLLLVIVVPWCYCQIVCIVVSYAICNAISVIIFAK